MYRKVSVLWEALHEQLEEQKHKNIFSSVAVAHTDRSIEEQEVCARVLPVRIGNGGVSILDDEAGPELKQEPEGRTAGQ